MGFTLPLALLLALGVGVVVISHALRKGHAEPMVFPAARLIQRNAATARKRHRIEDRFLLLLRSLMVLALALLAASPFLRCSRLTLARDQGASVSAVLIIDDSASMQAEVDGQSRLEQAKQAANQLLSDAESGDGFSVVLAGAPARVLVPKTTDLGSVKDAITSIETTDRGTDLAFALTLARGLQAQVAQQDQPIVLLSDLSLSDESELDLSGVSVPDIGITHPLSNCALMKASLGQKAVLAEVTCTDAEAIKNRSLQVLDENGRPRGKSVSAHDGVVTIPLPKDFDTAKQNIIFVQLSPSKTDQIQSDDRTSLLSATTQLSFAVRADMAKAGVKTASDTVLQAGLEALERGVRVQPLSVLPDEADQLDEFAGLLIDDPSGFSPEVRNVIESWVERGGVAAVFLGPGISTTPLGSNFSPFLNTAPQWTADAPSGAPTEAAGALGPLTTTWNDLAAKGRALWGPDPDAQTLASWVDDEPLIAARALGEGLLLVSSLPSSVEVSDFALRPAYLELLDYIVAQANIRMGAAATPVGQRWRVPRGAVVTAEDGTKLGLLAPAMAQGRDERLGASSKDHWFVEPDRAGRYGIENAGQHSVRYATRLPQEHIAQPRVDLVGAGSQTKTAAESKVGISREMALAVLILTALELVARVIRQEKSSRSRVNLHGGPSSSKVPAS